MDLADGGEDEDRDPIPGGDVDKEDSNVPLNESFQVRKLPENYGCIDCREEKTGTKHNEVSKPKVTKSN